MKLTILSGARPNFMKIAPVCRAIETARQAGKDIACRLLYAGPDDDPALEPSLFSDLDMSCPDACLGVRGANASQVAADALRAFEAELDAHPADFLLVVDDTTAAMAASIVAKKRGMRVAHVIAGTRSFNLCEPREVNRTIIDAIADILFAASIGANANLNQEGLSANTVVVGNVLIDTLRHNRSRLIQPLWFDTLGLRKGRYLLLTLNRHDLLARKPVLQSLLSTLVEKAGGLPIVAPLHPYAEQAVRALHLEAPNLHLLPPQTYLHFGFLVDNALGIVTDSGNIAEEAHFDDTPCITLSTYAEHPETWRIGTNELVGDNTLAFAAALDRLLQGRWKHATLPERWDGHAAERIVQTLLNLS